MSVNRNKDGSFRVSSFCDLAKPSPQCVEVAQGDRVTRIRSSKAKDAGISFDDAEWSAFIKGVKNGEFDV